MLNQDNRKSDLKPSKNIFENEVFDNQEMEELYKICDMDFKLTYSLHYEHRKRLLSSKAAVEFIRPYFADHIETKEYFYLLFVNNSNQVLTVYKVSEGGLTATVVDCRLFLAGASKTLATCAFMFHNHPSGNLQPSNADKALTEKFKGIGKLIDCTIVDHIILTADSYYSFADEGMI